MVTFGERYIRDWLDRYLVAGNGWYGCQRLRYYVYDNHNNPSKGVSDMYRSYSRAAERAAELSEEDHQDKEKSMGPNGYWYHARSRNLLAVVGDGEKPFIAKPDGIQTMAYASDGSNRAVCFNRTLTDYEQKRFDLAPTKAADSRFVFARFDAV